MNENLENINIVDELENTFKEVKQELIENIKRYGDKWKERGVVWYGRSQEEHFYDKIGDYILDFHENGTPIPWLKIIYEAHIALVKEKKR